MPDSFDTCIASIAILEGVVFACIAMRIDPPHRRTWKVIFLTTFPLGVVGLCLARFQLTISIIKGPTSPLLSAFVWRALSFTIHNSFSSSLPAISEWFLVVIYVVFRVLSRGGRPAVKKHWSEIKDGFLAAAVISAAYFLYNCLITVPREMTSPSIKVTLTANDTFSLDYHSGGAFDLTNKKQYLLVIQNVSDQKIDLLDMWMQFPTFIEARNMWTRGMGSLSLQPDQPFQATNTHIQFNGGCVVETSYHLNAEGLEPGAYAHIALILRNGAAFSAQAPRQAFIAGYFRSQILGKTVQSPPYYAPLELGADNIVKLGKPGDGSRPPFKSSALHVLAGPCIPDAALVDPSQ